MFKNNFYKKNKDIVVVPKNVEKHDVKTAVKPNVSKNNYENIRNIVEEKAHESISNSSLHEIKNVKNKLNII
jgi:hypothetical protein